ncbi:hypothetical protein VTN02DRAFT_2985 [Thermoascus thermophilus]
MNLSLRKYPCYSKEIIFSPFPSQVMTASQSKMSGESKATTSLAGQLPSQMDPLESRQPILPGMDNSRMTTASDTKPGLTIDSTKSAAKAKPVHEARSIRRGRKKVLPGTHLEDQIASKKKRHKQKVKRLLTNATNHIQQLEEANEEETEHAIPPAPLTNNLSTPEVSELECGDFCTCCAKGEKGNKGSKKEQNQL